MEANGPAGTKTRERTECAAKAVQAMHGDSFSTNRVDPDPMCSTSFGVKAEPPALPCRDDFLVENGAAAPKSCLPPLKMRSPTAASGLLPVGMTFTATRTTFHQLASWVLPGRRDKFEDVNPIGLDRQNLIFDPGGSKGRIRACPFLGTWRTLLCRELLVLERLMVTGSVFCGWKDDLGINLQERYR